MLATTKQPEHDFNSEDYYEVLGIDRNATIKEIVAAYRNLVNEKHPDKQYGDTESFRLIQEAFSVIRISVKNTMSTVGSLMMKYRTPATTS